MRHRRDVVTELFGYRIERVRAFGEHGDVTAQWYEVLAPGTGAGLGGYAHRAEAERAIVARELTATRTAA
ncbi:MAG TPA: hypothetical protein VGC30_07155 [Dokdonella sp.]